MDRSTIEYLETEASLIALHAANNAQHTVLIAEDSDCERARLVAIVRKLGFRVIEANNGAAALNLLSSEDVSLFITDWQMPKISGLEVCRIIVNDLKLQPYVIMLTGRSSMGDKLCGLRSGADDYLSKPFDSEELQLRLVRGIKYIDRQQRLLNQNVKLSHEVEEFNSLCNKLSQERNDVRNLQRSILPQPQQVIHNYKCAYFNRAACNVGGDSFSVLPLKNHKTCFFQVDVTGTGLKTTILSYAVHRILQGWVTRYNNGDISTDMSDPAAVLSRLNNEFVFSNHGEDYFTFAYGCLDLDGTAKIAIAGHPNPRIVLSEGRVISIQGNGVPIGLFKNSRYINIDFNLGKHSRLYLHTDGVYGCRTSNDKKINDKRLDRLFSALAKLPTSRLQPHLNQLFERLIQHQLPKDDISLLVIERV